MWDWDFLAVWLATGYWLLASYRECLTAYLPFYTATSGKKQAAKSKEELAQEKKKELEKRLQDVSGQLNSKKPTKKGNHPGHQRTVITRTRRV